MYKWASYTFVVIFLLAGFSGYSQIDKILKPVEINPPHPPMPQEPKKESDEQLAAQYFRDREYDKAVVFYEKLFNQKKNQIYYTYYLFCLIELDEFNKAEKLVKSQVRNYPVKLKYIVDLGYVYTEAGEFNKAKKQFEEALKKITTDKSRIIELANAFLIRGQFDYAVATYRKGRQVMRNYPFYIELGDLYRQTRNYSMMIEEYLDYVDYDDSDIQVVQHKLQNVLSDDPDKAVSELLRKSLLRRVQRHPDKIYFSEMLLWLSIQQKDFELAFSQAKSIDRRLNEQGERIFDIAELSLANQNYDVAIDAYKYILKKGKSNVLYLDAKIGILNARYLKITNTYSYTDNDLLELEKDYISVLDEYGRNASTIQVMQFLGHLQAFYLDKSNKAIELLYEAKNIRNASQYSIAKCKLELADILLFTGDVWEAKLLYAQVEKAFKNDPIGHLAKFKNARLSFYIGEFDWAKAQLNVLKAATSKLIANDALSLSVLISDNIDTDSSTVPLEMYSRADLLLYRNKNDLALATLDSVFGLAEWHPIFDEVLFKKAEIKIKQKKHEEAASYLSEIVDNYSYDITADNALFLLAELYEWKFNDKDKAMQLYQQLLTDYPASLYTVESRKRFRRLRGDFSTDEMTPEEKFFYDIY